MYMRKDYLNGKCTHRQYYGQFVNEKIKNTIKSWLPELIKCIDDGDIHFNNIKLIRWDCLPLFGSDTHYKFKECGDYLTKAGAVCLYKEAGMQLIEEYKSKRLM